MTPETYIVEKWLRSKLSTDAALIALVPANRIRAYVEGDWPCVVYMYQTGADVRSVGSKRSMSGMLFSVKAVGVDGGMEAINAIAGRIDALLDGAVEDLSTVRLRCAREQPISQAGALFGTTRQNHLGGVYRFRLSPIRG